MRSNKTLILFALAALLVGLTPRLAMALFPDSYICTGSINGVSVRAATDSVVDTAKGPCVFGHGQATFSFADGRSETVQVTSEVDSAGGPMGKNCADITKVLPSFGVDPSAQSQAGQGFYDYHGGSLDGCRQGVQFNANDNTTEFAFVATSPLIDTPKASCGKKGTGGVLHCIGSAQ
jgi:hypothetical protein